MKLLNKILDALSLYDEEEVFDDEVELKKPLPAEEKPQPVKTSLFKKKNVKTEAPVEPPAPAETKPEERKPKFSFTSKKTEAKSAEPNKMGSRTLNLPIENKLINVIVLEPVSFADSQKIADHLRGSQPVVVNFANTDNVVAKRMSDYISGTIYALNGSMKKIGRDILVCAPKNVDIDAGAEMYDEKGEQPWKK